MKPYYRKKGKYNDGRSKIVIEWQEEGKTRSVNLPKPEALKKIIDRDRSHQINKGKQEGNRTGKSVY